MSANIETLTDWRDYYELTKPRVVMLIVFTAIVGMFLAVPIAASIGVLLAFMISRYKESAYYLEAEVEQTKPKKATKKKTPAKKTPAKKTAKKKKAAE